MDSTKRIIKKKLLIIEDDESKPVVVAAAAPAEESNKVVEIKKNLNKLNTEAVTEFIRNNEGLQGKDIAKKFGVNKSLINTSHDDYIGLYKNENIYHTKNEKDQVFWFVN
jgi:aspartyl aminopeptidase